MVHQNTIVKHNIEISNHIFKANLNALKQLANDNVDRIRNQFDDYIRRTLDPSGKHKDILNVEDRSEELSHVDWLFLNSIFTSTFAYFESHLGDLAYIIESMARSRIKIKDMKASNHIDQYKKYLYLVGGIEAAVNSKLWKALGMFRVTRNKLLHHGGILMSDAGKKLEDQPGYQFLVDHNVTLEGDQGQIKFKSTDFINRFIADAIELIDELTLEIKEKYPEV